MLALRSQRASETCTPNLLPCQIRNEGPVNASRRYWAPQSDENGTLEAYFRGRKLKGRELKVPAGYTGVVVREVEEEKPQSRRNEEPLRGTGSEEEEEEIEKPRLVEKAAEFEEIVVWGHDSVVDDDDAFVKGIEEWIGFAEAVSILCVDVVDVELTRSQMHGIESQEPEQDRKVL